jgi:hypothetical protein
VRAARPVARLHMGVFPARFRNDFARGNTCDHHPTLPSKTPREALPHIDAAHVLEIAACTFTQAKVLTTGCRGRMGGRLAAARGLRNHCCHHIGLVKRR